MLRIIRYGLAAAAALLDTVLVAVLTLPLWLVPGLAVLLPPGWALDEVQVEPEPPRLPTLRRLALFASGCRLLSLDEGRAVVAWQGAMPTLDALHLDALTIDPACLAGRTEPASAVVDLPGWVGTLFAGTRLQVDRLVIAGWLPQPHRLELGVSAAAVEARVEGPALQLAGRWDAGAGITVHELQMGQAQLATAALTVLRPRLVLDGPARLDIATGRVTATAHLSADRLNLTAGGKLEQPAVTVRLEGPPNNLGWTAEGAAAGGIGPLRGTGIWSGETLSGRLALARQALTALRPLLPPTLPVELQAGQADVEVVVTWSRDAPSQVRLDGELNVSQARLALTHAVADGVAVRLPFGYAAGVWRLGDGRAGQANVARIVAAVDAESASARIAGTWPWSARSPLRIEGLTLRALGGEVALDSLRLPQRGSPATLRLRGIQLDQVSALYGDAGVSLSGAVEADLPLHLDDATLLVEDGVLRNATPLRLRLTDAAALEAFKASNHLVAQAADWLADLHIDRLEGKVNLRRDGALVLETTVEGRNPEQDSRPVRLNYRHEENLLHLLQSLRIGSDLSRSIEERLSPMPRSGP